MITSLTRAATSRSPRTFAPSSAKSSPNTSALPTSSPSSPASTTTPANSLASCGRNLECGLLSCPLFRLARLSRSLHESLYFYDKFMTAFAIGVNRGRIYCDGLRFSRQVLDFKIEQIIVVYLEHVLA